MSNPSQKRLLKLAAVLGATGLSQSGLYAKTASGQFPQPVKISSRAVGWVEDEVTGWIEARIRERDTAAAKKLDAAQPEQPPVAKRRGRPRKRVDHNPAHISQVAA